MLKCQFVSVYYCEPADVVKYITGLTDSDSRGNDFSNRHGGRREQSQIGKKGDGEREHRERCRGMGEG